MAESKYMNQDENDDDRFRGEDDDDVNDDAKLCTKLLKDAYELKKFNIIDDIIADMVSKSTIDGLTKLHSAAGYGFAELVEKYINEDKIDPNCECLFNELGSITPLHFCAGIGPDAITPNRYKCIGLLVKSGANVNKCTTRLDSPLHWAAKISNKEICKILIQFGAEINIANLDSCTCAHGAAFYKNLDVLELLIENNVDVNMTDCTGKTILHLLCKNSLEPTNSVAVTEYTSYSNPSSLKTDSRIESMHTRANSKVAKEQLIEIISSLIIDHKMIVNCRDSVGFTPLMYACEYGNIELINLLITHGANVNLCSEEGITCMLLAIVNAEVNVVRCLLANGFNLNDKVIQSSYLTDAAYLNDIEIVSTLLDAGADVNETREDENGAILNPLWAACERANIEIVGKLLESGANPIIREDLNMTALHCVAMAQYESVQVAELLKKYKCPLNTRTTQAGETPLFLACNSGYAEIVEFLLKKGVNPNDASALHRTCFQQAVFRGYKNIILLLLKYNYKLTDDDLVDMNLLIMDLCQDNDKEMLKYLLDKNLTNYETILKCVQDLPKVNNNDDKNKSEVTDVSNIEELIRFLRIK